MGVPLGTELTALFSQPCTGSQPLPCRDFFGRVSTLTSVLRREQVITAHAGKRYARIAVFGFES
jgi:hypothetical protein